MSIGMPSLDAVRDALNAFHAAVRSAHAHSGAHSQLAASRLHADMVDLVETVTVERDAVLSLARGAGATWEMLESTCGVADSTLRDRLTRWEAR